MSASPTITPLFLDRISTLLAPLFLAATGGDMEAARETVRSTLASYNVRTDNEVRVAALAVAFGFGALDALSKAANRELSLEEVMDLRDSATALSAAGQQNEATLDRLRKQRLPERARGPGDLPASTDPADLLAFARSHQPLQAASRGGQRRADETGTRQQDLDVPHDAPGGPRTTLH